MSMKRVFDIVQRGKRELKWWHTRLPKCGDRDRDGGNPGVGRSIFTVDLQFGTGDVESITLDSGVQARPEEWLRSTLMLSKQEGNDVRKPKGLAVETNGGNPGGGRGSSAGRASRTGTRVRLIARDKARRA